MPGKGGKWSNLTIRAEVRESLDRLRRELGVRDLSDLIAILIKTYEEHTRISSKLDEILTRLSSIDTRDSSTSSATRQGSTSTRETKQRVVRWVKTDKIGNLEVYFLRVQDREGRPILWNNPSKDWACWSYKEDVERVVEELNREKWPLNNIQKHEEGWELYRCGLIYKDGDVWKVAS